MARRDWIAWGGPAVFTLAFVWAAAQYGLPWSRDRLTLWLLAGLLAVSLTDVRGWARGVLLDWLPLLALLFFYDLLRGYADELMDHAHVMPQLRFDEILFGGTVPTVTLQNAFYDAGDPKWWDVLAWAVYTSHFFVPLAVAAGLWVLSRVEFRRYAAMFVTLTFAGFVTYVLVPAVPPWMASSLGELEPTHRLVWQMWSYTGVQPAAMLFQGGNEYANDVAALPSLHGAYPVLLALFLWRRAGRVRRVVLVAYPLAMALALVYGAEHYVSDILLGWVYAVAVFFLVRWLLARRAREVVAGAQDASATAATVRS